VGTLHGEVICLDANTGKEQWRATIGEPIQSPTRTTCRRCKAASAASSP
jgi:glucose dehydrogenase